VGRVFVDTNVLFPYSVMDLMLALTEDGIHEVVWSDFLLDEWERVIVRRHRRSPTAAAAITQGIRVHFTEGRVPLDAYAGLVDQMPSRDPDDRHHIAAAVAGGAEAIITWNRRDFPAGPLRDLGLRVADPDEYLRELLAEVSDEVVGTVIRVATDRRRTPAELADVLDRAGVGGFAAALRTQL
jgi:predicted nucleic acid-binding protein